MDRAYAEPLDVRAVAAVAYVSEAHFIRTFRAAFGETPHRYLKRRRVEGSMFLLRETDRKRRQPSQSHSTRRPSMPTNRSQAERIHELVMANAPNFVPRTYYGMPAYSLDGKTICFFKPASKFKDRYSTLGFETAARIDDGDLWPVAFAVINLTPAAEAQIVELVKKAAS
jgi:AraC-like DNA-binding protein